ncbi:hypothetical protein SUGI_0709010 [Cryptomeria japonica]|nr:hypothetical protein SUGI_0709010 [Cryptomeria japonica]
MASFSFASVPIYYEFGRFCKHWSRAFKGPCFDNDLCDTTCLALDNSAYGECHWCRKGLACFCYKPC